ncbi:MAG: DUF1127 domain-containing protein [Ruegeria sp.]
MPQIAIQHSCNPAPRVKGNWLQRLFSVSRQRRDLARLDQRALSDIGITRQQAYEEAARSFWDAPTYWQKSQF